MAKARRWTAYYHALMDLLDDQVGRILEVMDRRGLWENTLVLFTSDHGEMRGDLGLYSKGNFYEPVTRVPAIVVPPGGPAPTPRFDGLVEMFDLAPTALDYAGVSVPAQMAARSLRPEVETGRGGRQAVFTEYVTNDRRRHGVCVRTKVHKLALWTEAGERGGELYALSDDPDETTNRFDHPAMAGVRSELMERIVARWLEVDAPAR